MAPEMVKVSEKLKEADWDRKTDLDWAKKTCELAAEDPGKAKNVIKDIKKVLRSSNKKTQLYNAIVLLEMLMNKCGGPIHKLVIDNGLLPILVKIVKTELPVQEKIFCLLDATQRSLGAKTEFPEYYVAYCDLVSAGVQFSNRPNIVVTQAEVPVPETRTEPNKDSLSTRLNEGQAEVHAQPSSDTSIIRKASSVVEVLRDVLNLMDPRQSEVNPGVHAHIYKRLEEALAEAELLKKEAYEESTKRRRAETDMVSALKEAKEMENLYQHEIIRRQKAFEEMITEVVESALKEHRENTEENRDLIQVLLTNNEKLQQESALKERRENMEENLIQVLLTINEKLQQERDAAVAEAEGLRQNMPLSAEAPNTEFSSYELEQATQGFSEALKIGEGGFGSVYKGFLWKTTVAIKLLRPQSMQGQSEFNQEIAVLSRVRHPNLVTLIGSCREAFGLVYEFLPNGSLEDRLACTDNTPPLTWQVRTRIIFEMCSALIFLHSNRPHPVVHGDLNPANILLDANFVSKLGDFGICRLLNQSTTLHWTATPKGTYAYMAPELLSTGKLTPRSDVYSFGIIILRLLTGRPAQRIVEVVKDAMKGGALHAVLDPTAGSWPVVQAQQLAHVGLRCAEMSWQQRPDLAGEVWKVVEPLNRAASLTAFTAASVAAGDDSDAPSYFLCPIFHEVMRNPQIAADGYTYEAAAIRGWFDRGGKTSPMTNLPLAHCDLTPNRALHDVIHEWRSSCRARHDRPGTARAAP